MVDERNELASMYKGFEQTDLGLRTDVISNKVNGTRSNSGRRNRRNRR